MGLCLPDGLAESKPLPQISHLPYVVAFVKRQERDRSKVMPLVTGAELTNSPFGGEVQEL
jgi:hypothetical protein